MSAPNRQGTFILYITASLLSNNHNNLYQTIENMQMALWLYTFNFKS